MQISICMMVKDEEKNIRTCLDSVLPILQNADSELIIIDTGSQDNTIEIIKGYTDKIFFHKWEGDFSGMRNKSISYAKGKWILIIDADEEIMDCNNIIAFLKSPKAKPFNTGLLDVKNMFALSKDAPYAILKSPRLFKNDGDFHYEGIVHNNPIFKEPTIDLETTIVHYGYVEENEEIADKKFIRTSILLKRALEKEPENIYYLFQLSVTYRSHKDYDEAYEIAKVAYNLLQSCKEKKKYKYVYYQMALCYLDFKEDQCAKEVCTEGLKVDGQYIDLMFYLGKTQGLTGEYEKALETYKKYINSCDNYHNMKINFDVSLGMYTLGQKDEALQDIVKLYFKLEKFDEVLYFAFQIEKEKYIVNSIELIIKSAIKTNKLEHLKNFYEEKIHGDKAKEEKFFLTLECYCNDDIYELFSVYDNDYSKLYLLRYNYIKNDNGLQKLIDDLIFKGDFNNSDNCFGDIIYYKLKYCRSMSNLLLDVWDKNINRYLEYVLKKYEDFTEITVKYIKCFADDLNLSNLRLNKILCRYILLMDKLDDIDYKKIFTQYINVGAKYIECIYNKQLIKDDYINILDEEEDKFLIFVSIAMENKQDKKAYIKYLRKALDVYPYMKKGIEVLKEELLTNEKSKDKKFEEYKVQVKNTIRNLIESGQLTEAKKIIGEYETIVKEDIEIYSIKATVAIMQGELDDAEKIVKKGLYIEKNNFDLLYNLAYIFQMKNQTKDSIEIYGNLLGEVESLEIAEQLQNNIIVLQKKLEWNENIFLNIHEYENEFISSIHKTNYSILENYIEYLIGKYFDLKEFFYNLILNSENIEDNVDSLLVKIEIAKVILKFKYTEEVYCIYNTFICKYVSKVYNLKNVYVFYNNIENVEEKNKVVLYLLNEAIKNKDQKKAEELLHQLLNTCDSNNLKYSSKQFFTSKIDIQF